jgi:TolA-binding protein
MTIMRKIVFIIFSISAFIYLVLQTSHGQLWLSHTHFGESTKDRQVDSPREPKEDALIDSFTQFLQNSKHAEQISALEIQLNDMQTSIANMSIAMQEVTTLNATLHEKSQLLGKLQKSPENNILIKMVSPSTSSKASKADARMRQLEHQARLQEVVQRMELTALQAISR